MGTTVTVDRAETTPMWVKLGEIEYDTVYLLAMADYREPVLVARVSGGWIIGVNEHTPEIYLYRTLERMIAGWDAFDAKTGVRRAPKGTSLGFMVKN